ncbi:MAG: glycosyltransferase [Hyphomicrobiaceae bacterium]|nr:glycosyltransferase [Hyphomicrobiaceae bacterium]
MATRSLHVVQVGWDTALLQADAPSDSAERQHLYSELLEARRPGSRMTIVVLGADRTALSKRQGGVAVVPVSGRWASIAMLPRILAQLNAERPISVIAPQSPLEEGWACLAFARGRIPVVAQVHFDMLSDAALPGGGRLRSGLGQARRRIALRLLPSYAGVRTVAPDMAEQLLALGARVARAVPVPILDLEALLASKAQPSEPRVLFVGRLAPEKNLDLWLAVAQRVAALMPDVHYDIVGAGALRPALEGRARQLGLDTAVTFHGALPRAALPDVYRQASVLLLTSNHEGFGRVLVEAMAAGVPVVSTCTAGAREVLADGGAGILAPVGDVDTLADGVIRMLSNATERAAFIAAGRRRIAERYRPQTLAAHWVDMLIEAVEQRSARPPQ